jgi:hypothetical protein
MFIDLEPDCRPLKRGDLLYSNAGNKRMRTWFVIRAKRMRRSKRPYRFKVWMARWWEIETDMRNKLYQSAERAGGQNVIYLKRYPAKKKRIKPVQWGML